MSRSCTLSERLLRFWRAVGEISAYEIITEEQVDEQLRSFLEAPDEYFVSNSESLFKVTDWHLGKAEVIWLTASKDETGILTRARHTLDTGLCDVTLTVAVIIPGETSTASSSHKQRYAILGRLADRVEGQEHNRQELCLRLLEISPAHAFGQNPEESSFKLSSGDDSEGFVRTIANVTWPVSESQTVPVTMAVRPDLRGASICYDNGEALIVVGDLCDPKSYMLFKIRVADCPLNFTDFFGDQRIVFGSEKSLIMIRMTDCSRQSAESVTKSPYREELRSARDQPQLHVIEERPCCAIIVPLDPWLSEGGVYRSSRLSSFLVYRRNTRARFFQLDRCFYLRAMERDHKLYIESLPDGSVIQELVSPAERIQTEINSDEDGFLRAQSESDLVDARLREDWNVQIPRVCTLFGGRIVLLWWNQLKRLVVLRRRRFTDIARQALTRERYALALRLFYCLDNKERRTDPEILEMRSCAIGGFFRQFIPQTEKATSVDEYLEDLYGHHPGSQARIIANAPDITILRACLRRYEGNSGVFRPSNAEDHFFVPHAKERPLSEKTGEALLVSSAATEYAFQGQSIHNFGAELITPQGDAAGVPLETIAGVDRGSGLRAVNTPKRDRGKSGPSGIPDRNALINEIFLSVPTETECGRPASERLARVQNIAKHVRQLGDTRRILNELEAALGENAGAMSERDQSGLNTQRQALDWLETNRVLERLADRPEMTISLWHHFYNCIELEVFEKLEYVEALCRIQKAWDWRHELQDTDVMFGIIDKFEKATDLAAVLELAELYGLESAMQILYRRFGLSDELAVFLQNRSRLNMLLRLCLDNSAEGAHLWEHALICLISTDLTSHMNSGQEQELFRRVEEHAAMTETDRKRHWFTRENQEKLRTIISSVRKRQLLSSEAVPVVLRRLWRMWACAGKDTLSLPFDLERTIATTLNAEDRTFLIELLSQVFGTEQPGPSGTRSS
jgi:hypothetical protein